MRGLDRPGNSIERQSRRLGGELHLAPYMEEGKVPRHKPVLDPRRNVLFWSVSLALLPTADTI